MIALDFLCYSGGAGILIASLAFAAMVVRELRG